MPNAPNTPGVLNSIKTICSGLQVNGSTFFQAANVEIGTFKDITQNVPACEITMVSDESKRFTVPGGPTQGGKIDDSQHFQIAVTLDMTDSVAVETQLANIRDALSAAFMSSATLNTVGVSYSGWDGNGQAGYAMRNGQQWRKRKMEWRTADASGRIAGQAALYPPGTRVLVDACGQIADYDYSDVVVEKEKPAAQSEQATAPAQPETQAEQPAQQATVSETVTQLLQGQGG